MAHFAVWGTLVSAFIIGNNNIIGIASSTSNPIGVVTEGTMVVATDGTATIGDNLCMGATTDGKAHDNGLTACSTGVGIGVVIATSGTVTVASGSSAGSQPLSTTLPLVQLHFK